MSYEVEPEWLADVKTEITDVLRMDVDLDKGMEVHK